MDLDLIGSYQAHNLLTACAAADYLHEETPLTISRRAFLEGTRNAARNTNLQGRWQRLAEEPLTICDTGHNAHGLRYVAEQLAATPHERLFCVVGFVREKNLADILPLLPAEATYLFTQAPTERAVPAPELAETAARYGLRGEVLPEVKQALDRARELAGPYDLIFVGGSNFIVAEVL